MAVRIMCGGGSIIVERKPYDDAFRISGSSEMMLRKICGPEEEIHKNQRDFYVEMDRERLPEFLGSVIGGWC